MHGEGKKYSKYFPDTGISALFGFLPNGKAIAVKQSIW
jgi:hypothetical protein